MLIALDRYNILFVEVGPVPFIDITPEQEAEFHSGIVSGRYSLLLGAGASRDSKNKFGPIPLGSHLEQELSDVLGVKKGKYSLQKLYATLTDDEKATYIRERFSNCEPGKVANAIERYSWKRIFTLNIDDSLNNSYSETSQQSAKFVHFLDPYEDFQTRADLPVVHLHGSVRRHDDGYVFSHQEYARIIKGQNPWMMILTNSMRSDPMIISGASMEEVDIEYYLSFRSRASSRDDFPPSIFVSNEENRLTKSLCKDHNLIQFRGYSPDFFEYLSEKSQTRLA
ncbi:SIR2 family protein [Leisingera caerulea]|uniref:SIR2 family protein n=1 Tax=Leisingera caerulea TaxID=506591 RepID=A0ABY5WYG2_LEICA|nr:SIR2 family protein [Leisingera caerulea]UWQ59325.1 SIR2 family protein [Leisingera caerulea]